MTAHLISPWDAIHNAEIRKNSGTVDGGGDDREFVNFVHNIAHEIAKRADSGMSFKEQVLAAADEDLVGFCERFIECYDAEFHPGGPPNRLSTMARLAAAVMIRQHEHDTGKAETFAEMYANAARELDADIERRGI